MSDIVLIMQALANPNKYGENGTAAVHLTEQGKLNADMDGNGLTVGDAQAIQNKLLGKTASNTGSAYLLGLKDSKVKSVKVTSYPPDTEQTFTDEKAQKIIDYLSALHLSDENLAAAAQTKGRVWHINIEYENNETALVVHSGNKYIRNSELLWYSMIYDEAIKFSDLIYELSKDEKTKYESSVDWNMSDLAESPWELCSGNGKWTDTMLS